MKLNGWQRLWVLLVAIWGLLLIGLSIVEWSTMADIPHSEVYALMPRGSASGLLDSDDPFAAYRVDTPEGVTIADIGEHTVTFRAGVSKDYMDATARLYAAAMKQALAARHRERIVGALTAWALPSIFVYGLGWGVAWVRRGF